VHYYVDPTILNDYKIVDTVGAGDCFTSAFTVSFYRSLAKHGIVR
jgi:ribokinase